MASPSALRNVVVWIIHILVFKCNILSSFADLSHVPPKAEVLKGSSITLPCITSYKSQYYVDWQHIPVGSSRTNDIFFMNHLNDQFASKYKVTPKPENGEYNLTILSAELNDAGTYVCIDVSGGGEQRRTRLIVFDSQPVGSSNVSLDNLAICGEEVEYFGLFCNVTYKGDESPRIRWMQIFRNGSEVEVPSEFSNIQHESAFFHLSGAVKPEMDGSHIRCLTSLANYSWSSEKMKVHYALNITENESTQEREVVSCQAQSNQGCNYRWTQADTSFQTQTLDLDIVSPGTYRCIADCNILAKLCTVHPKVVNYTGKEEASNITTGILIAVGIAVAAVVFIIAVILFVKLKNRRETPAWDKEERKPLLKDENVTPTGNLEKLIVRGIAELDNLIYIIFQGKSFIRVIKDLTNFEKERDIHVFDLVDPWNLEACSENKCLYVSDRYSNNNCIWKVKVFEEREGAASEALAAPSVQKWMSDLRKPHKFSVISEGRIVVPKWNNNSSKLEIYASDCVLQQTIELPWDMLEPYYALEVPGRGFVVAHGHQKSSTHRVCKVVQKNNKWNIEWSYPSKDERKKINDVDILAIDAFNRIFVTDQNNQRVIILDMQGRYLSEIKTEKLPYRICYARNNDQLLVGHFRAISLYKGRSNKVTFDHIRTVVCESSPFEDLSKTSKSAHDLEVQIKAKNENRIEIGQRRVTGITELNNTIYMICQNDPVIKIFKENVPFDELDEIPIDISDPWFIDACPVNECLYITDRQRDCVIKVSDLDGNRNTEMWKTSLGEPYKLSVISRGRVLIPKWPRELEIYRSDGELEETIALSEDLEEPCHAVEVENGVFILGHGDKKSERHRVCKVEWSRKPDCKVIWAYGNERGNKKHQLNRPRNVTLDDKGNVFVTDEGNQRIVLLDENGILMSISKQLSRPERIFYSRSFGQLFVGQFGSVTRFYIDEKNKLTRRPWIFPCNTNPEEPDV